MKKYVILFLSIFILSQKAQADWNGIEWGITSQVALNILKTKSTGITKIDGIEPYSKIEELGNRPLSELNNLTKLNSIIAHYKNAAGLFDVYLFFNKDDRLDRIILYSDDNNTCFNEKNAIIKLFGNPLNEETKRSPYTVVNNVKVHETQTTSFWNNHINYIQFILYSGEPYGFVRKCTIIYDKMNKHQMEPHNKRDHLFFVVYY